MINFHRLHPLAYTQIRSKLLPILPDARFLILPVFPRVTTFQTSNAQTIKIYFHFLTFLSLCVC